jgi:hypothetical protein
MRAWEQSATESFPLDSSTSSCIHVYPPNHLPFSGLEVTTIIWFLISGHGVVKNSDKYSEWECPIWQFHSLTLGS